jgi:hypothetical protein
MKVDEKLGYCRQTLPILHSYSAKQHSVRGVIQCCQLAEISAAKHKSGPIKISAAGRNSGRICCRFFKNWQKSGRTFLLCALHLKALIICRNRLVNPHGTPLFLLLT